MKNKEARDKKIEEEQKEYAIIAVAAGEGVVNMFKDLRVDYIVSGGQTMNPATEDFVNIVQNCNAKNIFILPNNSNIILAPYFKNINLIFSDLPAFAFP